MLLLALCTTIHVASAASSQTLSAAPGVPEGSGSWPEGSGASVDDLDALPSAAPEQVVLIGVPESTFRVAEVAVSCAAALCDDDDRVADLVDLLALGEGIDADAARVRAGAGRLIESGTFSRVEVTASPLEDGYGLQLVGEPTVRVRRLRVQTLTALSSEIRRRIFLRSGSPWDPDPELIARQRRTVEEYFEERGYFGSRVAIEAVPHPTEPTVDVTFDIERGRRRAVNNVYVRGNEVLDYEDVRTTLLGEFDLLRTFTTRRFARAQRALVSRYRALGYIQARVVLDQVRRGEGGLVDLFVEVREGPRWQIRFEGNRQFSDSELLRRLTFYPTGFVDDAEIVASIHAIAAEYETRGFYFASIALAPPDADAGPHSLDFVVDEGQAAAVRAIDFVGVTQLDHDDLRAVLSSQVYDVLTPGGYLQRAALDADMRALVDLYRANGFLLARPLRVVSTRGADEGDLFVTIEVSEGTVTRVGEVTIDAFDALDLSDLRRSLRASDPYVVANLELDRAALLEAAREAGYPLAQVDVACTGPDGASLDCAMPGLASACLMSPDTDREEACARVSRGGVLLEECRLVRIDPLCEAPRPTPAIDVHWTVAPGPSARFGSVFLQGNFDTLRSVLRRELRFDRGDAFDYDLLLQGQSDMRSLGIFDSVRVATIWHDTRDGAEGADAAAVVVQVEESRSQFFDHRVGLEARFSSLGDALLILSNEPSYRNVNFLGRAEELRVVGNFDFDALAPQRMGDKEFRAGLSLILFDPRFWLWGLIDDAWEARNEVAWTWDLLAQSPSPLRKEIQATTRVREEFRAVRGLSFEFGLSLRQTQTADQSVETSGPPVFEPALILSLLPRLTYDGRDSPLNPTRGWFAQVEFEVADDFFGVLSSKKFTQVTLRTSAFVPLGRRLVFGSAVRVGLAAGGLFDGLRSASANALPLSERFSLGGVTTLRGFPEGAIAPAGTTQFGGDVVLNGSFELRYPFLADWGLNGAVFVDWGQLTRDVEELDGGEFRFTTGLGVRWLIADLVPVVIDYGAVLGRRPGERPGRLHFNIGYTF